MDKDAQKELIASGAAMLRDFAHVAKTTADHLYSVLVRQQLVDGFAMIITPILLLMSAWSLYHICRKIWTTADEQDTGYSDDYKTGAGFLIAGVVIATVVGICCMAEGVKHLINPEYYALEWIFNQVRP